MTETERYGCQRVVILYDKIDGRWLEIGCCFCLPQFEINDLLF